MNLPDWLTNVSPLLARLPSYRRETLIGDLVGALIVTIMLVPQAMAYAMLAGLPPQVGLYASILPLFLYSLFGSSSALAVGPVAMVSLLVVSGVGELALPGSPEFISLCLTLALMVGVLQILMSVFRFGFLVNFISHPVLIGFTSAAAIVIGFSQLKHLFGIEVARSEYPIEMILATLLGVGQTNGWVLAVGVFACAVLMFFDHKSAQLMKNWGVSNGLADSISRFGPLVAVLLTSLTVGLFRWNESHAVGVVGAVPAGLPGIAWPSLTISAITSLLPLALIIALVGYLESYSVAKALASRDREKIDANRELFALGMADVGAALTGGYPVTGGFSRSAVSQAAGVRTQLGSAFTAIFVAISVLLLSPFFFYIPKSTLAMIILVSVASLIDLKTPIQLWRYSRSDAIALLVTFAAVILVGIENGIFIGIASTAIALMWRTSRPHIAEVGRVAGSEHFRNVKHYEVETIPGVVAFRVDESLNFANAPCVESFVLDLIADRADLHSLLLVASGVNDIDATGIEVLSTIREETQVAGVSFYLSHVKGPVIQRLRLAGFDEHFLQQHVFLSTDLAFSAITANEATDEPLPQLAE